MPSQVFLVEDAKTNGQHHCADHGNDLQVMPDKNLLVEDSQPKKAQAQSDEEWKQRSHALTMIVRFSTEQRGRFLLAHHIGRHSARPIPAQDERADGRDGGEPQYGIESHVFQCEEASLHLTY